MIQININYNTTERLEEKSISPIQRPLRPASVFSMMMMMK